VTHRYEGSPEVHDLMEHFSECDLRLIDPNIYDMLCEYKSQFKQYQKLLYQLKTGDMSGLNSMINTSEHKLSMSKT
jgi:hypothetical protein